MSKDIAVDFEIQIKRLAGMHQRGEGYQETKNAINAALMNLSQSIGSDASERVNTWSKLHNSLKNSLIVSADPLRVNAIRFAISRVQTYKKNAVVANSRVLHIKKNNNS